MRVLVIEDEESLRRQLVTAIQNEGFIVESSGNGKEGHYLGEEFPVDIAVVDIGLPELSGIEIIQRWRKSGKTFPILILTARGRWQEKVEGLESGADDYMVKPFDIEELIARLRALMRRASGWTQSMLECGPVSLDLTSQEVKVHGEAVDVTGFEYRVLEYLMLHAGEVISKTELTEHIYHQDFERDSNVIEVFMGRLRKKLDPNNQIKPIETLRGRGYRLGLPRNAS